MKTPPHPMQPLVWDDNVIRFKRNKIVEYLLDHGGIDLNKIQLLASEGLFSKADQRQFAQLIGYSVSGYGDLSYAEGHKSVRKADKAADKMILKWRKKKNGS